MLAKDELLSTIRHPDYINQAIAKIIEHNDRGEDYNLEV